MQDTLLSTKPMKSNEWYTPAKYIEAARQVMGSIDLDPASCELANQTVKAIRYYTREDDGLSKEWYGNVWLNPPFAGNRTRIIWTQKLLNEYHNGAVEQAVLLMPAAIETQWFRYFWCFPICFPASRIFFYTEKPRKDNPNFASCLIYIGTHEQRFIDIFSQFGTIAKRVNTSSQSSTSTLSLWESHT